MDCLYRLVLKATQSLIIFLICPPTSGGKCLINGQTYMVHRALSRDQLISYMGSIGDMVFFKIFGQPFLVLGSKERTFDLFERRSSNYSDRPHFPMISDVLAAFPLFMSNHAHQKAGWNMPGTWDSLSMGSDGGTIAVPSMIISIQTSSASINHFK